VLFSRGKKYVVLLKQTNLRNKHTILPFTNRHSRIDSDGNTPQQTTLRNKDTIPPFTNRHSRIDSDGNTPQQTTLRNKQTNGKEKVGKRRRIVVETYNIIRVYSRRVLQCVAVCCGVLPSESQCVAEFLLKLRNSGAKATCC